MAALPNLANGWTTTLVSGITSGTRPSGISNEYRR